MKQETKPTSLQKKHNVLTCRNCNDCRRTNALSASRELGAEIKALYDSEAQSYWFYFTSKGKR